MAEPPARTIGDIADVYLDAYLEPEEYLRHITEERRRGRDRLYAARSVRPGRNAAGPHLMPPIF
jgi:hypothetical protein